MAVFASTDRPAARHADPPIGLMAEALRKAGAWPWLLAALTALVYAPALTGGFVFDDHHNVLLLAARLDAARTFHDVVAAVLQNTSGPTGRPVSVLTLALDAWVHGASPFGYKVTNVLLHLLNGALVYALVLRILRFTADDRRARLAALLAAAAFLLHPIAFTNVAYVVQRMNLVSSLFILLGLHAYLSVRHDLAVRGRIGLRGPLLMAGLTAMATLGKENGALLPLYCAVLEFALLVRIAPLQAAQCERLRKAWLITAGAVALGLIVLFVARPGWLVAGYVFREFDAVQRVLTEARALWWYLGLVVLPLHRQFGLFHDDWSVSTGLLSPPSTALAVGGWLAVLMLAWWYRRRAPMLTFAVAWYLAGHCLESSVIGLELVFEHRNYLPLVGPWIAIVWYVTHPATWRAGGRIAAAGAVVVFALVTVIRAEQWSDPVTLAMSMAQHHPGSFRSQYELGRVLYGWYLRERDPMSRAEAIAALERAAELSRSPLPLIGLARLAATEGTPMSPQLEKDLARRLRTDLLQGDEVSGLIALIDCAISRECVLRRELALRWCDAALDNPRLAASLRVPILVSAASVRGSLFGDTAGALAVIDQVIRLEPGSAVHRLSRAKLLQALGRRQEARAELEMAEELVTLRQRLLGRIPSLIAQYRDDFDQSEPVQG